MTLTANATWLGFRFPSRLLTVEEIEIFSPKCSTCGLVAVVVEKQGFVEADDDKKPLGDFPDVKFYCSHHTTIEVPENLTANTDYERYLELAVQVSCPRYMHKRYASNCIKYNDTCLDKCQPIQQLLRGLTHDAAVEIIKVGRERQLRERRDQQAQEQRAQIEKERGPDEHKPSDP